MRPPPTRARGGVDWTCPTCGAANAPQARACEGCGTERARGGQTPLAELVGARCGCGAEREAGGRCLATGQWPRYVTRPRADGRGVEAMYPPCPTACPICRQRLSWSGACFACHGSRTGDREDWTHPGDCYEPDADGAHWVKAGGPARNITRAELTELVRQIRGVMAAMTPDQEVPR